LWCPLSPICFPYGIYSGSSLFVHRISILEDLFAMARDCSDYNNRRGRNNRIPASGSNQTPLGNSKVSGYKSGVSTLGLGGIGLVRAPMPPQPLQSSLKQEPSNLSGHDTQHEADAAPEIALNYVGQYSVGGIIMTYEVELAKDREGIQEEMARPGTRSEFKKLGNVWAVAKDRPDVIKEIDQQGGTLVVWRGVTYGEKGIADFSQSVRSAHMVINKATKPLQDNGEPAENDPLLNQFENLTGHPDIILERDFKHKPKAQSHIRLDSTTTVVPHQRHEQVGCLSPHMFQKILEAELGVLAEKAAITLPNAPKILLEIALKSAKFQRVQEVLEETPADQAPVLGCPTTLEASIDSILQVLRASNIGSASQNGRNDHTDELDETGEEDEDQDLPRRQLYSGLAPQLTGLPPQPSSNKNSQPNGPLQELDKNKSMKRSATDSSDQLLIEVARQVKARKTKSGTGTSAFAVPPPPGPADWCKENNSSYRYPKTK
ncbi:hypothetical protein BDV96DRAFT_657090, partial [Lophiotrema nucula]